MIGFTEEERETLTNAVLVLDKYRALALVSAGQAPEGNTEGHARTIRDYRDYAERLAYLAERLDRIRVEAELCEHQNADYLFCNPHQYPPSVWLEAADYIKRNPCPSRVASLSLVPRVAVEPRDDEQVW
jgi:hypothetical protein